MSTRMRYMSCGERRSVEVELIGEAFETISAEAASSKAGGRL
jgi:hypothetical protein